MCDFHIWKSTGGRGTPWIRSSYKINEGENEGEKNSEKTISL